LHPPILHFRIIFSDSEIIGALWPWLSIFGS